MIDRPARGFVAKRVEVSQPAILHSGTRSIPVHLLDLSLTGAMVLADIPPSKGSVISLTCASEHVSARVAWTRGNHFGLAFVRPLTAVQAKAMAGMPSFQAPKAGPKPRSSTASLGAKVIKREEDSARF